MSTSTKKASTTRKTAAPRKPRATSTQTAAQRRTAGVPAPVKVDDPTIEDIETLEVVLVDDEGNERMATDSEKAAVEKIAPKDNVVEIKKINHHVKDVREHADKHAKDDGGGWDVIRDTWTDQQISDVLGRVRTKDGAIGKVWPHVKKIRAERDLKAANTEIETGAFENDSVAV